MARAQTAAQRAPIADVERSTSAMEQIEAEKALRESDARFRELADTMVSLACSTDPQ